MGALHSKERKVIHLPNNTSPASAPIPKMVRLEFLCTPLALLALVQAEPIPKPKPDPVAQAGPNPTYTGVSAIILKPASTIPTVLH